MTDNERILTQIDQITQMGQVGINYAMPKAIQPALRQALRVQRLEYQTIGAKAKNLAKAKGLKLRNGTRMMKHLSAMSSSMQFRGSHVDSKIAGTMIQGNTRGMIQSLKGMHHAKHTDPDVAKLAQSLLESEINNIRQMEGFL